MDCFATFEKGLQEIAKGRVKPAYLLAGDDFWVAQAIARLLDVLIPESERSLNLEVFDSATPKVERALLALATPGFFPSRKVVVIERMLSKSSQSGQEGTMNLEDNLLAVLEKGVAPGHVLVLTCEKLDPRRPLFKKIADTGFVIEFKTERDRSGNVHRRTAETLLTRSLQQGQKKIEPSARALVLRRAGKHLRQFAIEIDKLLLFIGERQVITIRDVEDSFKDLAEGWVFDLTEKIGSNSPDGSLSVLWNLFDQGEHPLRLVAVIGSELKALLRARGLLEGQFNALWKNGMGFPAFKNTIWESSPDCPALFHTANPYRAFLLMTKAATLTVGHLKQSFLALHAADLAMKTSSTDPERVMESLMIQLSGTKSAADNPSVVGGASR